MCNISHSKFTKREFILFLEENNVSPELIIKFSKFPETLKCGNNVFTLNIELIFNGAGNTSYGFELNYYCKELIEFLFNYKIFSNIELSINYLACEINKRKDCH
jgi:hypothetical protein